MSKIADHEDVVTETTEVLGRSDDPRDEADYAAEDQTLRCTRVSGFDRQHKMSVGDLLAKMFDGQHGDDFAAGLLASIGMQLDLLQQAHIGGLDAGEGGLTDAYLSECLLRIHQQAEFGSEIARRMRVRRDTAATNGEVL